MQEEASVGAEGKVTVLLTCPLTLGESGLTFIRGNTASVQFSCSVMSDSLQPHKSQHTRPPCPSPTPGVYPNSYPSSWWCHPAISSSAVPFSSCPQFLPASGSFPMSQLFASGGQNTGVSASVSVLPIKHPGLISFRMDWSDLLAVQGIQESSLTPQFKSINSSAQLTKE